MKPRTVSFLPTMRNEVVDRLDARRCTPEIFPHSTSRANGFASSSAALQVGAADVVEVDVEALRQHRRAAAPRGRRRGGRRTRRSRAPPRRSGTSRARRRCRRRGSRPAWRAGRRGCRPRRTPPTSTTVSPGRTSPMSNSPTHAVMPGMPSTRGSSAAAPAPGRRRSAARRAGTTSACASPARAARKRRPGSAGPRCDDLADGPAVHRLADLVRRGVALGVVHPPAHVRVDRQVVRCAPAPGRVRASARRPRRARRRPRTGSPFGRLRSSHCWRSQLLHACPSRSRRRRRAAGRPAASPIAVAGVSTPPRPGRSSPSRARHSALSPSITAVAA